MKVTVLVVFVMITSVDLQKCQKITNQFIPYKHAGIEMW